MFYSRNEEGSNRTSKQLRVVRSMQETAISGVNPFLEAIVQTSAPLRDFCFSRCIVKLNWLKKNSVELVLASAQLRHHRSIQVVIGSTVEMYMSRARISH
jgi:hypothetical protein